MGGWSGEHPVSTRVPRRAPGGGPRRGVPPVTRVSRAGRRPPHPDRGGPGPGRRPAAERARPHRRGRCQPHHRDACVRRAPRRGLPREPAGVGQRHPAAGVARRAHRPPADGPRPARAGPDRPHDRHPAGTSGHGGRVRARGRAVPGVPLRHRLLPHRSARAARGARPAVRRPRAAHRPRAADRGTPGRWPASRSPRRCCAVRASGCWSSRRRTRTRSRRSAPGEPDWSRRRWTRARLGRRPRPSLGPRHADGLPDPGLPQPDRRTDAGGPAAGAGRRARPARRGAGGGRVAGRPVPRRQAPSRAVRLVRARGVQCGQRLQGLLGRSANRVDPRTPSPGRGGDGRAAQPRPRLTATGAAGPPRDARRRGVRAPPPPHHHRGVARRAGRRARHGAARLGAHARSRRAVALVPAARGALHRPRGPGRARGPSPRLRAGVRRRRRAGALAPAPAHPAARGDDRGRTAPRARPGPHSRRPLLGGTAPRVRRAPVVA